MAAFKESLPIFHRNRTRLSCFLRCIYQYPAGWTLNAVSCEQLPNTGVCNKGPAVRTPPHSISVSNTASRRIGSVRHQEVTSRHRPLSASDPHPVHPPLPLRFRQRLFDYIWRDQKFSSSVFQKTMETGQKSDTYRLHQRLSTFLSLFPTAVSSPEESEIASTMRNLLEKQCISVLPTLPLDSALSLADIWYLVSEIDFKVPCFHRHFVDRLMQDPSAITLPQAIQAFLYCAIYRKITVQGQDILRKILLSGSDLLSVNDLELIAFGAYVLKIPFRDNPQFLKRISDVLHSDQVDISTVVTILKFLRQNVFLDKDFYQKLASKLSNHVSFDASNGVECCHILQCFAAVRFHNEQLYDKLQAKILENMKVQASLYGSLPDDELLAMHPSERLRAKDVANLLYSLASMNHPIREKFLVYEDLKRRRKEFELMPYLLVQSSYALSLQGTYDKKLLDTVFSSRVQRKLSQDGWKDAQRWLFCLYKSCEIEFPEGIQDAEVSADRLAAALPKNYHSTAFEMKNRNHELISTVRSALHKHYGKEAVWWGRIVPHVEISGFVIKLASDDLVQTLLRSTAKAQPVMVSKIPKKIAIEVLDNWVTCDNTDKTLGVMDQKKRFLEILGFQILTVTSREVAEGILEKKLRPRQQHV